MARFVRDEKNTFPFTWLIIGSLFAVSTVWAVYAELVTRVPWQDYQDSFYQLELRLATEGQAKAAADWEKASQEEPLKSQLARAAELDVEMKSGDFAAASTRLAELDTAFATAENKKTFGASDLDEAYYYRNLAEYERDAAAVHVREAYKKVYADDPARAQEEPNNIYVDPPAPTREQDETVASHHLRAEIARMTARRDALEQATKTDHPPELLEALKKSLKAEQVVIDKLLVEQKHQARINAALKEMAGIDGPPDPRITETDPAKTQAARQAAREAACAGHDDTRNCIKWIKIAPKDNELKQLNIAIAKAKRPLEDAEQRLAKAKANAKPEFDLKNPIKSMVGPFQIKQTVLSWMRAERDVDLQQVDRCETCHLGANNGSYTASDIPLAFRTHPDRELLARSHPIEKFGCTVCHQGQGRATDNLAHSGWHLEVHHGHERWHYAGDHYWEDPLLPVGKLTKVLVDDRNDTFEVKLGKGKRVPITLDHREPTLTVDEDESPEDNLLAELQTKLQGVVDADETLKANWRAAVRKIDNRISLGLERLNEATEVKEVPAVEIAFTKIELAEMLGFGYVRELKSAGATLYTAHQPPVAPIRAESPEAEGVHIDSADDYKYVPPNGAAGLQVPDEMRNRLIRGLPEIESGCLRCHNQDADLVPWRSHAKHVDAKLAFQRARAERTADPAAYRQAHGTDDLPPVPPSPQDMVAEVGSLAPTLDYGRWVFRQLNCTGCHLLRGYENNKDAGPQLDDISSKVKPEWLLGWLRHPRGWRPKTSMPNLWPRPLDPATKLPYAEGTPEYQAWDKQRTEETLAVASFLWDRSENPSTRPSEAGTSSASHEAGAGVLQPLRQKIAGLANVDGASAELGKELFIAYGCQGCHANSEGKDLAPAWRARERDIAPTLANLKNKIQSPDWVAYWVKNPSRYWHGTSMPNLRLTDVEAASLGQYLVSLEEKPPFPAPVSAEEVKLVTEPSLRAQEVECKAAGNIKLSRVACGQKIIEKRGCFGCHQITGFDKLAPIGPELTGFAQKDISTLDFGYAISDHHLQTTETFAALKLDSPRIYERDRIELFMGDFDMSPDEIRAVVVFLKGAINGRPNEHFDPMQQEMHASVVRGRQLVNDLNCRGCHLIEGRGAEIDGFRQQILTNDGQQRAPYLDGEGARVQPEWLFTFLRAPGDNGIRPWLHPEWVYGTEVPKKLRTLRMPTFNLTAEQWTDIVRYFASWDQEAYPFQVPKVRELQKDEKLWAISNMNSTQTGNCLSCHYYRDFPIDRAKGDLKKMAPDIDTMRRRLRPSWVKMWLLRPQNFLPYTSMTAFFATKKPDKTAMFANDEDPFLSPKPKGWNEIIAGFRTINTEEHVELLRDFIYSIPEGAAWPAAGKEADSAMVDPEAAARIAAEAAAAQEAEKKPEEQPAEPQPGG